MLEGSVGQRDGLVRLAARLSDAVNGNVVWAVADTVPETELTGFDVEERWATRVAAELGDYAGVVYRHTTTIPAVPTDTLGFKAKLAFQAYVEGGNPETLVAAEEALAAAMDAGFAPVLLAMRGTTLAVRATYGISDDPGADLAGAEHLAREALSIDPGSGHAHVVLGTVALTRGQWDLARAHSADAARSSPSHPTILATAGSLIAYAGEWDTRMPCCANPCASTRCIRATCTPCSLRTASWPATMRPHSPRRA